MKSILFRYSLLVFLFCMAFMLFSYTAQAQIERLLVETYYIADSNDATDTTENRSLEAGMKTYRVFLDLAPGSKVKSIFGNANHPLRITSTSDFYNNIDRPNAYFGYLINKGWYSGNPTLALDSWLTIGLTATQYLGIPKSDDTDGSFIGGSNNNGGSNSVPGGLMTNTDPGAGIPVTTADGYVPNTVIPGQWFDQGFKGSTGEDTTVFGSVNTGNEFLSYDAVLQQNNGVGGADPDSNKVLIAQLTTSGDLSFEFNVVIEQFNGSAYTDVIYVANGDSIQNGAVVSPFLSYPPACGCIDPAYLEFSTAYACSQPDSCQTLVVLGCMDVLACNYDPLANINIPALCCYPGSCDDRDLSIVCPSLENGRFAIRKLFPNPANNRIIIQLANETPSDTYYTIINSRGQTLKTESVGVVSGMTDIEISIENLSGGLYQLFISGGGSTDIKRFIVTE